MPKPDRKGRKRGPKPDFENAVRVAEIVVRVAPDGEWRSKLDEACQALDEAQIPCPKKWRVKDRTCLQWSDCIDRPILVKAIEYRLNLATQQEQPTSETFS
jgi:hypothetical protein